MQQTKHIYPDHDRLISRSEKEQFLNQKARVFWFTGLSGSGKSTIAHEVEKRLFARGHMVQLLDGDNIRMGISKNLGFSLEDRFENIRRISEVSKILIHNGIICLNCFVSPTQKIRNLAREIIGDEDFKLIFMDTPLKVCEDRDVKGLYKKARSGEIKGFTGIDSPFESPQNIDLVINSGEQSIEESVKAVLTFILREINPE